MLIYSLSLNICARPRCAGLQAFGRRGHQCPSWLFWAVERRIGLSEHGGMPQTAPSDRPERAKSFLWKSDFIDIMDAMDFAANEAEA